MKHIKGWSWAIQDGRGTWVLCHWIRETRKELLREGKPSTEARAVKVLLVPIPAEGAPQGGET